MQLVNGKNIEEEEFEKLDEKTRKQFEENSIKVQEQIIEAINQIKVLEKENIKKIEEWQSNIALITINSHVNPLKAKYKKEVVPDFIFDFEVTEEENEDKIVKRKKIDVKPMDEEEAILQMELLGHDFYVFNNIDEECISVLYRRKDGNYGIINTK